jgi:hypothetical protein
MELPVNAPTPAPAPPDASAHAIDDAAMLAAPELPAPPIVEPAVQGAAREPDIRTLWWLIGAVVALAVLYFAIR